MEAIHTRGRKRWDVLRRESPVEFEQGIKAKRSAKTNSAVAGSSATDVFVPGFHELLLCFMATFPYEEASVLPYIKTLAALEADLFVRGIFDPLEYLMDMDADHIKQTYKDGLPFEHCGFLLKNRLVHLKQGLVALDSIYYLHDTRSGSYFYVAGLDLDYGENKKSQSIEEHIREMREMQTMHFRLACIQRFKARFISYMTSPKVVSFWKGLHLDRLLVGKLCLSDIGVASGVLLDYTDITHLSIPSAISQRCIPLCHISFSRKLESQGWLTNDNRRYIWVSCKIYSHACTREKTQLVNTRNYLSCRFCFCVRWAFRPMTLSAILNTTQRASLIA